MEAIAPAHGAFERSLLARLVREGVLADEPVTSDGGSIVHAVRFSFERYSDHRIARQETDLGKPGQVANAMNLARPLSTCFRSGSAACSKCL